MRATKSDRRPKRVDSGEDVSPPGIPKRESVLINADDIRYEHLLGRVYITGKQDCGSLIKDFYQDNFDIELTDYARPDNWWQHGMNIYYDIFRDEGFQLMNITVDQMQIGDIMLMAFVSPFPDHAAIYVGQGKIIHHFYQKLSECEGIRNCHRNTLLAIGRRPDIIIKPPAAEELNLINMLPPYFKHRLADKLEGAHGKNVIQQINELYPDKKAAEDFTSAVDGTDPETA